MSSPADNDTYGIIAPDGTPRADPARARVDDGGMRELLRQMILVRRIDEASFALQGEGELTSYPPLLGQEAAQVGSAAALGPDDFVFPSFREFGVAIARGVDPVEYLLYHRGTWHGGPYDPIANRFGPVCVPTASQIPHAVGYAMGAKLDGKSVCAVAYFGEGSASEGDFHEACNLAAVFRAPVVFFCQNNGWAISVPFDEQAAAPIWLRARGYGFPGVRVDGNDVLAVREVTIDAVERARSGGGPTLIEAMTYRLGPHSTNDDDSRYRSREEVERWRALDPIARFRTFLAAEGVADDAFVDACERQTEERVAAIRAAVASAPPPPPEDLFAWTFAELPPPLAAQREEMVRLAEGGDG